MSGIEVPEGVNIDVKVVVAVVVVVVVVVTLRVVGGSVVQVRGV